MNKQKRKQLHKIAGEFDNLLTHLQKLIEELQDTLDNIPDNLNNAPNATQLEQDIYDLEEIRDKIGFALMDIESLHNYK